MIISTSCAVGEELLPIGGSGEFLDKLLSGNGAPFCLDVPEKRFLPTVRGGSVLDFLYMRGLVLSNHTV